MLNCGAQAPLTVFVRDFHDAHDVQLDFVHNQAYLDEREVRALQQRLRAVLDAVLESRAQATVRTLPVMTAVDAQQLLAWNATDAAYPQHLTVVELFQQQVDETPEATAVVFEGRSLSYAELDARANQVAHALIARGVEADTLVGLCVPRSLEMVIGLLGMLKAGGAYVPLDPDYPEERLRFMVQDAQAAGAARALGGAAAAARKRRGGAVAGRARGMGRLCAGAPGAPGIAAGRGTAAAGVQRPAVERLRAD